MAEVGVGVGEATPTEITDLSVTAVVTVDQGAVGEEVVVVVVATVVPSTAVVVEGTLAEEAEDGGKYHQR